MKLLDMKRSIEPVNGQLASIIVTVEISMDDIPKYKEAACKGLNEYYMLIGKELDKLIIGGLEIE